MELRFPQHLAREGTGQVLTRCADLQFGEARLTHRLKRPRRTHGDRPGVVEMLTEMAGRVPVASPVMERAGGHRPHGDVAAVERADGQRRRRRVEADMPERFKRSRPHFNPGVRGPLAQRRA